MNYAEFIIKWAREHPQLSYEDAAEGAQIAWARHNNPPIHDPYSNWMADTKLILGLNRAIARFKSR